MLQASGDYLQALREGKYLLFLEWPRYIVAHYSTETDLVDASELVELITFEWLYNGYTEHDVEIFTFLYKLCEASFCTASDEHKVSFPAELEYSVATIYSVVLRCLAYHSIKEQELLPFEERMTKREVLQWMEMTCFASLRNEHVLASQRDKFSSWLDEVTATQIDEVLLKLKPILVLREQVVSYLDVLDMNVELIDDLKASRAKEANQLLHYLGVQLVLTDNVRQQVQIHVSKLWSLKPQSNEEQYLIALNALAPRTRFEASLSYIAGLARINFFSLLQPSVNKSVTPSPPTVANS